MHLSFNEAEELLVDEGFLAWYHKTDPVQLALWDKRLSEDPALKKLADDAIQLLNSFKIKEVPVDTFQIDNASQRFMNAIDTMHSNSPAPVIEMKKRKIGWWSAAAVLLLIIGAALLKYGITDNKSVLQTQYGQIKSQVLPDGSEVTLNANTKLSYKKGWQNGKEREVWVEGEAFFHVQKTAQKTRFIVHSGNFDVIVTGTQFNIINRNNRNSILLKEGSVTLKANNGIELQMKPGELAEYTSGVLNKQTMQVNAPLTSWKEHKFIFEKTPMKEVASAITEMYGVKVTLQGEAAASTPISGVFPNDNLDILLESLEASQNFEIQKTAEGILIRKQ